jgi:hypothetical protein
MASSQPSKHCAQCKRDHVSGLKGVRPCMSHSSGVAHPERKGEPCRAGAMRGQDVCARHGGKSGQARAKAAERVAIAAAEAEAERTLAQYMRDDRDVDPGEVLLNLICTGWAKVKFYRQQVIKLEPAQMVWGMTKLATGGQNPGETFEAKPNIWITLLDQAENAVGRYCVDALRVGLKQREIDIAERMAERLMPMLDAVLAAFGHDPQAPDVAETVERALRLVA